MDSTFSWSLQWPLLNSYTSTAAAYKRIQSNQYDIIVNSFLIPALMSISMQKFVLIFINENVIRWILPTAFVMRFFPLGEVTIEFRVGKPNLEFEKLDIDEHPAVRLAAFRPRDVAHVRVPERHQDDVEKHHGNGEEDGQELRVGCNLREEGDHRQVLDALLPDRVQDLSGLGAAGAVGRAVAALVAEPHVGARNELVLLAPLGEDHLLAREGVPLRRHVADDRAGGALVALFERLSPALDDVVHEL